MTKYSLQTKVSGSFESAVIKVKEALKQKGFGILTEINVKETLEKKLNIKYSHYVILGACNPRSAYKALQEEKEIGLLLPCNVIVYEDDEVVIVSAIRPTIAMGMIENKKVLAVAKEVEGKLEKVIASLQNGGYGNEE